MSLGNYFQNMKVNKQVVWFAVRGIIAYFILLVLVASVIITPLAVRFDPSSLWMMFLTILLAALALYTTLLLSLRVTQASVSEARVGMLPIVAFAGVLAVYGMIINPNSIVRGILMLVGFAVVYKMIEKRVVRRVM